MPYLLNLHPISFAFLLLMLLKNWRASAFRSLVPYFSHVNSVKLLTPALSLDAENGSGFNCERSLKSEEKSFQWKKLPLDKAVIPPAEYSEDHFEIHDNLSESSLNLRLTYSPSTSSPVESISIRGRNVYFKRDDLIQLTGSGVSGNKARKMLALNQIPATDFPECIASYGGPQSNAMLAIAAIVHSKNLELDLLMGKNGTNGTHGTNGTFDIDSVPSYSPRRFVYYTKKLPRFLKQNPSGNFFRAKMLGMEMVEFTNDKYNDFFRRDCVEHDAPDGLEPPVPYDAVWIPQGGACSAAIPGGAALANEIIQFWSEKGEGRPVSLLIPGGTCASALVLHREIRRIQKVSEDANKLDIKVVVIPCVGDEGYAMRQMMGLNMAIGGYGKSCEIPSILKPAPDAEFYLEDGEKHQYFRFGEPSSEILRTYEELKENGMNVDLLYGAPSWSILLRHWPRGESCTFGSSLLDNRELMYIHSGGLEGVNSQLMRYRHKGLIEGREVQHPQRRRKPSKESPSTWLDSAKSRGN